MSCGGGSPLGPSCGTSLANALWVNALATGPGTGSCNCPFPTPAAALAAVPSGASATIILAPADYSGTPALSIADRDINLICLGGPENGTKTPRARAVMPNLTFAASGATMQFSAEACDFPSVTVSSAVNATLNNCSSIWTDAGNLAVVRANGNPLNFGSPPQQFIGGTIGTATLYGMRGHSLSGQNIIATRGRVLTGGTGFVASQNLAFYDHEFEAGVTCTGTVGLFMDQWSWFQALEAGAVLGATPPISVQELSALHYIWGAASWANNNYFNPFANFGTAQPSAAGEWLAAPRQCYGATIHGQLTATIANNATATLHVASTVAGLNAGATALTVTIPAGQLNAQFGLTTPVSIARGSYMALRAAVSAPVAGNTVQWHLDFF